MLLLQPLLPWRTAELHAPACWLWLLHVLQGLLPKPGGSNPRLPAAKDSTPMLETLTGCIRPAQESQYTSSTTTAHRAV